MQIKKDTYVYFNELGGEAAWAGWASREFVLDCVFDASSRACGGARVGSRVAVGARSPFRSVGAGAPWPFGRAAGEAAHGGTFCARGERPS